MTGALLSVSDCDYPCNGIDGGPCAAAPVYDYFGCASNQTEILTGPVLTSSDVTQATCADFCEDYLFYGFEFGVECFCGDTVVSGLLDASDCNYPCNGIDGSPCIAMPTTMQTMTLSM